MRLTAIIFSLFLLFNCTEAFGTVSIVKTDTAKNTIAKKKFSSQAEIRAKIKRHKGYFDDCAFTSKYTLAQRLKKYPYSKAVKILSVSYLPPGGPNPEIELQNQKVKPEPKDTTGLPIFNNNLNYSKLIEVKQLTQQQVARLTDVVFNTDYKVVDGINAYDESACFFSPRNALIFFDKNGKIFDFIQICFECDQFDSKSERIEIGTNCTQKYDLLRHFFISVGIKYGTNKRD